MHCGKKQFPEGNALTGNISAGEQGKNYRHKEKHDQHGSQHQVQRHNAARPKHLLSYMQMMPMQRQNDAIAEQHQKCADTKEKTGQQNARSCENEREASAFEQCPMNCQQSPKKKWEIVDKHYMVMPVKNNRRCCQKQK